MTATDADAASALPEPASRREILIVYAGFMLVMGLASLDQSIVATALPRIVSDLGGAAHLSWVVTAYVLTSTATMPLYGKLSDQYGRKPLVYVAIVIFLVGSMLSGLSQSMFELIVFRAIQGIGAGGLVPLAQITISDLVPPRERGRYQGAIPVVFAVTAMSGPVIGGIITDLLSWHWIFYINLPLGIAGLVVIGIALKRPQRRAQRRIDYAGALLLALATTGLLLVMTLGGTAFPWGSPITLGAAGTTVALAVAFVMRERVAAEPIIPLILFRNRVFVFGCIVVSLTFMGLQGASVFFPLFFQVVLGILPSDSGLLTAAIAFGLVVSARINGQLLLRTGRYKPSQVVGAALGCLAFAALTWGTGGGHGLYVIEPALFVVGFGIGLVTPNVTIAIQNAVDYNHMGTATATMTFFRSLGAVIGVAGSGAIMNHRLESLLTASHLPAGVSTQELMSNGLAALDALPPQLQQVVIGLYRDALATSFSGGIAAVALAFFAVLMIPELELRADNSAAPRLAVAVPATGEADPTRRPA